MKQKMYRTQILLEPEQHRALVEVARREGRSVSDVVRGYVQEVLDEHRAQEEAVHQAQIELFEQSHREYEEALAQRGGKPPAIDIIDELNRMREERDADIVFGGDPGDRRERTSLDSAA